MADAISRDALTARKSETWCAVSAALGGTVWLARMAVVRPGPFERGWAVGLLLLAPLVLVPVGLRLVAMHSASIRRARAWRLAVALQLAAALLLVASFEFPAGTVAAALSIPWLIVTAAIAASGLARFRTHGRRHWQEFCIDAALIFPIVGGIATFWTAYDVRPLDFEPVIILLTAIHFHFAGFVFPLLTGLAGLALPGRMARAAALGAIVGVPLVAVGINATQLGFPPLLECVAAAVLSAAGLMTAGLHMRLAMKPGRPPIVRALWCVAGLALAGSMVLSILYGVRFYGGIAGLDIPWMRATHGTANAFGFALLGLIVWSLVPSERASNRYCGESSLRSTVPS